MDKNLFGPVSVQFTQWHYFIVIYFLQSQFFVFTIIWHVIILHCNFQKNYNSFELKLVIQTFDNIL